MRVVLRHLADAHQAVQCAVRLVAVATAEFGQAHRQIAVAFRAAIENLHMRGAVHRLQGHQFRLAGQHRNALLHGRHFVRHDEHVVAEFLPMPRLLPEAAGDNLRCADFLIARIVEAAAHILLQSLPDDNALAVPENRPLRLLLKMEQVHFAPQPAVVALFGLFNLREMRAQFLVARPARPVNPLQHFVVAVAAPICTGQLGQLERLAQPPCRRQMRAAA